MVAIDSLNLKMEPSAILAQKLAHLASWVFFGRTLSIYSRWRSFKIIIQIEAFTDNT